MTQERMRDMIFSRTSAKASTGPYIKVNRTNSVNFGKKKKKLHKPFAITDNALFHIVTLPFRIEDYYSKSVYFKQCTLIHVAILLLAVLWLCFQLGRVLISSFNKDCSMDHHPHFDFQSTMPSLEFFFPKKNYRKFIGSSTTFPASNFFFSLVAAENIQSSLHWSLRKEVFY